MFFAAAFKQGAFAATGDGPAQFQPAHKMRTGAGPGTVAAGEKTDVQMGMVVDLERCDGCMECVSACSESNGLSQGSLWALVMPFQEPENEDPDYLFRICQHCTRAPCVMVCPTGARHRRLATAWCSPTTTCASAAATARWPAPTASTCSSGPTRA
jgi:ferredoxin